MRVCLSNSCRSHHLHSFIFFTFSGIFPFCVVLFVALCFVYRAAAPMLPGLCRHCGYRGDPPSPLCSASVVCLWGECLSVHSYYCRLHHIPSVPTCCFPLFLYPTWRHFLGLRVSVVQYHFSQSIFPVSASAITLALLYLSFIFIGCHFASVSHCVPSFSLILVFLSYLRAPRCCLFHFPL